MSKALKVEHAIILAKMINRGDLPLEGIDNQTDSSGRAIVDNSIPRRAMVWITSFSFMGRTAEYAEVYVWALRKESNAKES